MNPKDWIDLLQRLFAWLSERRNPVRQLGHGESSQFQAAGVWLNGNSARGPDLGRQSPRLPVRCGQFHG